MKRIAIVMVDDDEDDRMLFEDAVLDASDIIAGARYSIDGVDLLELLRCQGKYADAKTEPLPDLIVLDLNMPRMNGYEVLEAMRSDSLLNNIPVVVMSTSNNDADVKRSYHLGASGFIVKPNTYEGVVETVKALANYWANVMRVPKRDSMH